ncbi:RNase P MRP, p29 subunit [Lecanosticta acicola]|uniref:Ribonuclease P protein subunit n=1 Tax=Lecanosticta acicola TaxID=111012 RepID=A0AAI9EBF9_9PEZI|nr:RNase P MRP, p29 subunit [Lecanosticta acicola]
MAEEPTEHIADDLLERAHPEDTANTIFREKVKLRPLLLRPTSPDPKLNARSKRQYERLQKEKANRKSKKPKPLSAKQKRALCVHEIPKEQRKYAIYEPLHRLWCGYMREILGLNDEKTYVDANSAGQFLASADYHGAKMEVVRSRCGSRVGLKGIVVKDTKFTFEIVTVKDELKIVPKEHTIFRFEVPFENDGGGDGSGVERRPLVFEILGSQFELRPADRANKKFKMHIDPEI